MKDLTLVTCSYNTPIVTLTMLKSFYYHHKKLSDKFNVIIMENSTNDETSVLLDESNIKYIRTPGATHSESVDAALKKVKTKYCLLVDTDIIFHKSMLKIYSDFKKLDITTMGEIVGSRGGYNLHLRVFPWFNFINMEQVNSKGLSYHNQDKITKSKSENFYKNIPLNYNYDGKFYDVGATFLEDILENGLSAGNIKWDPEYFTHYEGMSWRGFTGMSGFVDQNNRTISRYLSETNLYRNLNIKNKFIGIE